MADTPAAAALNPSSADAENASLFTAAFTFFVPTPVASFAVSPRAGKFPDASVAMTIAGLNFTVVVPVAVAVAVARISAPDDAEATLAEASSTSTAETWARSKPPEAASSLHSVSSMAEDARQTERSSFLSSTRLIPHRVFHVLGVHRPGYMHYFSS